MTPPINIAVQRNQISEKTGPFIRLNAIFYVCLIGIYIVAIILQQQLFLNWDVSYLLHATQKMLAGGSYSKDFFIPNPPIVLFLYVPPVLLCKLGISIIFSLLLYIFFLCSVSLIFCYWIAPRIFSQEHLNHFYLFILTVAFTLLILPLYEFGQRDHLLVILTLPYLLLSISRLEGNLIGVKQAFCVGLLAGLGFCIKPHFLLTFLLIELYIFLKVKSWQIWLRPETSAIMLVLALHLLITLIFFNDYVSVITPFLLNNYYDSVGEAWTQLLLRLGSLGFFCLLPFFLYLLQYKNPIYQNHQSILMFALIGFLMAYFTQHTAWYYHLLPALSLSFASLILWLCSLPAEKATNPIKLILKAACFLALSIVALHYLGPHPISPIVLIISTGLSLLSFYFITDAQAPSPKISMLILSFLLFFTPVCEMHDLFNFSLHYKATVIKNLSNFLASQNPHQNIYFFSTKSNYGFPIGDYAAAQNTQRFDSLWMMTNLLKHPSPLNEALVVNMIAADFHRFTPTLIFIDMNDNMIKSYASISHFNYLNYFMQHPSFAKEWQHYQFLTSIDNVKGFNQIFVYQRKASKGISSC